MSILLAEFGLMPLPDQWLLRAATFWNAIAALPPTSLYKRWLWMPAPGLLVCRRRSGVRGMISVSDKVLWIMLTSRSCLPTSGSAGMLSEIIWTFALGPILLRNHVSARTRELVC